MEGTIFRRFKNAVQAQEFYINQDDQLCWHWSYEDGMYSLTYKKNIRATDKVVHVEEIECDDEEEYVYDIETEDGTFQAGCGCIIVKNTDSIYTEFTLPNQLEMPQEEKMKEIFKVSIECAKRITDTFKSPIELEFEKVMLPFLLFTKKRYACLVWEQPDKPKEIDAKGLQLVRRDNCQFVKDISSEVLNKIMYDQDIKGAEQIVRVKIKELLDNKVPIDKLIISKSLKSYYPEVNKNGLKLKRPAHAQLADRMKLRDSMSAPQPGDRVPYVFIENKDKNALQSERIENPNYVIENNIKIDSIYYLDRQVANAISTLFELLVTDKNGNVFPDTKEGIREAGKEVEKRLWRNLKRRKENQMKGQSEISSYFSRK